MSDRQKGLVLNCYYIYKQKKAQPPNFLFSADHVVKFKNINYTFYTSWLSPNFMHNCMEAQEHSCKTWLIAIIFIALYIQFGWLYFLHITHKIPKKVCFDFCFQKKI